MSGRIRTLKPEWLEDELLAPASPEARVLSVALLLLADDYGNGRSGAVVMGPRVFPRRPEVYEAALAELMEIGFILVYTIGRQQYFSIRNWGKHQKVDRPGKPRVPGPPRCSPTQEHTHGNISETLASTPATLASITETLATDHGPGPGPYPGPCPDPEVGRECESPPIDRALTPDVAKAWSEGVTSVTGAKCTAPRGKESIVLLEICAEHSGFHGTKLIDWVRETAAQWARGDPSTVNVWKFKDWLNSGRKDMRPSGFRMVQGAPVTPKTDWSFKIGTGDE